MTIGGALSELNNLLKADDIPCYYKPSIKAVMDTIALEQEPRKGHWIPYLKEGLIVKCSECKSRYTLGYNFCPNCGADMREEVEE